MNTESNILQDNFLPKLETITNVCGYFMARDKLWRRLDLFLMFFQGSFFWSWIVSSLWLSGLGVTLRVGLVGEVEVYCYIFGYNFISLRKDEVLSILIILDIFFMLFCCKSFVSCLIHKYLKSVNIEFNWEIYNIDWETIAVYLPVRVYLLFRV